MKTVQEIQARIDDLRRQADYLNKQGLYARAHLAVRAVVELNWALGHDAKKRSPE